MISLIYFDPKQLEDYIFNLTYRKAYDELIDDFNVAIWTGIEEGEQLVVLNKYGTMKVNPDQVNIVWVRANGYDYKLDYELVNNKSVAKLCTDKYHFFNKLKDFVPFTTLDHTLCRSRKVVAKPINGYKGEGIYIYEYGDSKLDELSEDNKGYVFQEFVECSSYEPLDIKGVHDIRAIIVSGKIVGILVRTPKDGDLICNLARGGTGKYYDASELNFDKLEEMSKFLVKFRAQLPAAFDNAIYSIDFVKTVFGFKVIEMNHFPGIRPEYRTYIKEVKKLLNLKLTV